MTCLHRLPPRCAHLDCYRCRDTYRKRQKGKNQKPRPVIHTTHIAGYVPPKGWTAYALHGRVVKYG